MTSLFYPGRRLSYDGFLCTVRYVGSLQGTSGEWLGVEWDDATRGKHDGKYKEQQIFQCLSKTPNPASFVKSSRKFDPERTVIEAIKSKYGSAEASSLDAVVISGKVAEEVGFDKIAQEQARLADLRIVLIDQLVVNGIAARNASATDIRHAQEALSATCPKITELDLGWNTFESWRDIAIVCAALPKLRVLKIGGSRFSSFATGEAGNAFLNLTQLSLDSCLIRPDQVFEILHDSAKFASLRQLHLSDNNLGDVDVTPDLVLPQLASVQTLDISNNKLQNVSCLSSFTTVFPELQSVSLQANLIGQMGDLRTDSIVFPQIQTLNLSQNNIPSFAFVDELPKRFPNLKSLHITKNPFFMSDHDTTGDPKANDKKYYLTLARVASLQVLNYTKISAQDRVEGEIYYLSVADDAIKSRIKAAGDRKKAIEHAQDQFPRYEDLAKKYGSDSLAEKYLSDRIASAGLHTGATSKIEYPAGSLGARIVTATFYMVDVDQKLSATLEIPSTVPVTQLMARLTYHSVFKDRIRPLRFRFVYESKELDPVDTTTESTTRSATYGRKLTLEQKRTLWQEWGDWDADAMVRTSSQANDSTGDQSLQDGGEHWIEDGRICIKDSRRFKQREVIIPPALKRPWGDWLDGSKEVRIRIEPYQRG